MKTMFYIPGGRRDYILYCKASDKRTKSGQDTCQYRAWKAQGHSLDELPYRAILYPYGTIFVVFINAFLVIIAGYGNFIDGFDAVGL